MFLQTVDNPRKVWQRTLKGAAPPPVKYFLHVRTVVVTKRFSQVPQTKMCEMSACQLRKRCDSCTEISEFGTCNMDFVNLNLAKIAFSVCYANSKATEASVCCLFQFNELVWKDLHCPPLKPLPTFTCSETCNSSLDCVSNLSVELPTSSEGIVSLLALFGAVLRWN